MTELVTLLLLIVLSIFAVFSFLKLRDDQRVRDRENRRFRRFILGTLSPDVLPESERLRAQEIEAAHGMDTVIKAYQKLGIDRDGAKQLAEELTKK